RQAGGGTSSAPQFHATEHRRPPVPRTCLMTLTRWDKESRENHLVERRGPWIMPSEVQCRHWPSVICGHHPAGPPMLVAQVAHRNHRQAPRGLAGKNSFACLIGCERLWVDSAGFPHGDVPGHLLVTHDLPNNIIKGRWTNDTVLRRACLGNFDTRALIGDKRIRRLGARPL